MPLPEISQPGVLVFNIDLAIPLSFSVNKIANRSRKCNYLGCLLTGFSSTTPVLAFARKHGGDIIRNDEIKVLWYCALKDCIV